MPETAKLFINGRSQAVRLPAAYRFAGSEVFVQRDPITGNVILSAKPATWDSFKVAQANVSAPEAYLEAQDRAQSTHNRDPLADLV
jgi:antitoxin VapB